MVQLSSNIWNEYISKYNVISYTLNIFGDLYQCFSKVNYLSVVFSGRNQCYGHADNRDEYLSGSECVRKKKWMRERMRACERICNRVREYITERERVNSTYGRQKERMLTVNIFIKFSSLTQLPSKKLINKHKHKWKNILIISRLPLILVPKRFNCMREASVSPSTSRSSVLNELSRRIPHFDLFPSG